MPLLEEYLKDKPELRKAMEDNKPNYTPEDNSTLSIVIKPEALDLSALEVGNGGNEYRPTSWDEYIGQNLAKDYIKGEIEGCLKRNETLKHIFLSAPPGHGKTLFAEILAYQLNKKVVSCIAGEIKSEQQFVDKVSECNGNILFIDEANRIPKKIGFFILPILEQFKLHGQNLKPFTTIFATTHKGDLAKDLDALIQRFEIELELEHYTENDIIKITEIYKKKSYNDIKVSDEIYKIIAKNSRDTPRIARKLLRQYAYTNNISRVLRNNRIIKNGLTDADIHVLQLLNTSKGLGANNLAKSLRIKPQTYEYQIEPFLIFKKYIKIEGKRKITEKGVMLLENLDEGKSRS